MSSEERPSALLRLIPPGDGLDSQARVLARLHEPQPVRWQLPTFAGAALAAAAGLAWVLWPEPSLDSHMEGEQWASLEVSDEILIDYKGKGELAGTQKSPILDWSEGTVRVEVEPGAGIEFLVNTPEAQVRVLGTVFSVTRTGERTKVGVERGRVEVSCDGELEVLGPGDEHVCAAVTAGSLLARARTESPEDALSSLDEALRLEPEAMLAGEVMALRVETLISLDRKQEALHQARVYLQHPGPREPVLRRIAASLAMELEGCAGAVPEIEAIAQPTARQLVQLADCLPEDPGRARQALETALELSPTDEAPIRARLERL